MSPRLVEARASVGLPTAPPRMRNRWLAISVNGGDALLFVPPEASAAKARREVEEAIALRAAVDAGEVAL